MNKIRFVLPVVVFIAAASMAFTTTEKSKAATLYIQKPGICEQVDTQCNNMGSTCTYEGFNVYQNRSNPTLCADELLHQQ